MTNGTQNLDVNSVSAFLCGRLPGFGGQIDVEKFQDGQSNPTFLLKTPLRNYVLRRKPPGLLLKSAHAVDREYRVQRALCGTDVPVAGMYLFCDDESVIGSAFYVMEHIVGRTFTDPQMAGCDNATRAGVVDEMNRVLAALHDVRTDRVGLRDFGPPGNYYKRQIDRWTRQYEASKTETCTPMEQLMEALPRVMPIDDGQRTLVHGDYRIDNMIFSENSTDCLAVLDWELSTVGHPYADLASVIMQWRMPPGNEGRGLDGIDRAALGLPSDEEFIAAYCGRRGIREIEFFGFFLAFCFFRMAAILQGVLKRALDGNASNPERARKLGRYVPVFAERGLEALQKS